MRRAAAVGVCVVLAVASGCQSQRVEGGDRRITVTVLAAASLTEVFTELGRRYEEKHYSNTVTFSFAASSTLAQQIVHGAPGDVFAAANPATMHQVTAAGGTAETPAVFVRNRLVIAVPAGNPQQVTTLADLQRVRFAQCAPQVPCGAAATAAFARAAVSTEPVTFEPDVKATLTKLRLGEVDAAVVYRTDVHASEGIEGIEFSEAEHVAQDYLIAPLSRAAEPAAARSFIAYIRSAAARDVFAQAGFTLP